MADAEMRIRSWVEVGTGLGTVVRVRVGGAEGLGRVSWRAFMVVVILRER